MSVCVCVFPSKWICKVQKLWWIRSKTKETKLKGNRERKNCVMEWNLLVFPINYAQFTSRLVFDVHLTMSIKNGWVHSWPVYGVRTIWIHTITANWIISEIISDVCSSCPNFDCSNQKMSTYKNNSHQWTRLIDVLSSENEKNILSLK